jgi:signal peptidase I
MSDPGPAAWGGMPVEEPLLGRSESGQQLLAAFISALLPGLGHLTLQRRGRGLLLLAIFGALLVGIWPLRLEANPATLLGLCVAMVALCIFAAWDAAYGDRSGAQKIPQWWLAVLLPFALIVAAGHINWSTRAAGFQSFEIPSHSMENGVMMGDRIIVDRRYYEKNPPRDGDIAILMNPQGQFVIKRIVALGGETIAGHDGKVFLNGKLLNEPYVFHSGPMPPEHSEFGPVAVPAGKLFAMGDNREISLDSRSPLVGPMDLSALRGRALYTLRSLKNGNLTSLK